MVPVASHALGTKVGTALTIILLMCLPAFGQSGSDICDSSDTENKSTVPNSPQSADRSDHTNEAVHSNDLPAAEQKGKSQRGQFIFAPIPLSSPALGSGVIPVVGYIFSIRRRDEVSPPSVIGAAGLITNNGSRAFAVAGQLFIRRDSYRLTSVFFQGNLNYNLYGIGAAAGDAGQKLPLKQDGTAFLGEIRRRIKWNFFAGPRFLTGHSVITQRGNGGSSVPIPPDISLRTKLTAVGLSVERDTRRNRFYPVAGTLFVFTGDFYAERFGSRYSFQSYRATFNKYWSLSKSQVIAYNGFFCATGGQPPFYGNCIYGANNELRGYEAGRYLDRYMVATQLEYRLVLPKRVGLVGFGGIGGIGHSGSSVLGSNDLLPAGGAGLRFMLSKAYHVNLRADLAAGKNEHTFSMGVSEAF